MTSGIRRAFDFHGRSSIGEAWVLHLCVLATAMVIAFANGFVLQMSPTDTVNYVFLGLFALLMAVSAVPYASMAVRRFHDLGLSGWWALAAFVPFLGGLVIIPVFLIPGRGEMNRFGPPPGVVAQEPAAG